MHKRWASLEPLEARTLLTLAVATPLSDITLAPNPSNGTVALGSLFTDDQTAVQVQTSLGTFNVLLYDTMTAQTVTNFLRYVNDPTLYDTTFIHRSVPGFVVQGGGYRLNDQQQAEHIPVFDPVPNEYHYSNVRGTIAMAKTGGDPNSATSEWFVNLADNSANLDTQNGGFTVFGRVIGNGMDVVDQIAALQRYNYGGAFTDLPLIGTAGYLVTINTLQIPKLSTTGPSWMTLSVAGNTNPSLVTPVLSGTNMTLTYAAGVTGSATITVRATDLAGDTIEDSFVVTVPGATANALTSSTHTPLLIGTLVTNPNALEVTVGGNTYTMAGGAVHVSGTTWSLQLPSMTDGTYTVNVTALDHGGNSTTTNAQLVVDTVPAVTVHALTTNIPSPQLTGTVDDPAATISVHVNGADYAAVNNGNSTWTLAAGQIATLSAGTYDVTVSATDGTGHTGTDARSNELVIDLTAPAAAVNALTTNVVSPRLTGTVDDPMATVTVTVGGADYTAVNNGDGTWTLAAGQVPTLAAGTYPVTTHATDLAGNVGANSAAANLTIDLTAPTASASTLITANTSPALSGAVDDPTATITITLGAHTYIATNNGNGTWTLPEGTIAPLANGLYRPAITATDPASNATTNRTAYLLVEHAPPKVTMTKTLTTDTTPALAGTINDPGADVVVIINSVPYDAVNNGNGTWTLPDNTLATLAAGTYTVTVAATDALGNSATANGKLSIATTVNVTMGAGISTANYADADGTLVTLTAGTGNLTVSFTGLNVTVTGTGKTRTITANGGIQRVAVQVMAATKSLAVKTGKGGDGLTKIDSITGAGILASLTGTNLVIAGDGIHMDGRIQSINVHTIAADVVMNAATLPAAGITITIGILRVCTIQAPYIKSLAVNTAARNANVDATAITALTVKGSFENTNITADALSTATLYNVVTDNDSTPFGLTVSHLTKLTLKQGATTLVWGTDFTTGILDLFITA